MNFIAQPARFISNPYIFSYPTYNTNVIEYNPTIHIKWKHFNTIVSEISYNSQEEEEDTNYDENKGSFFKRVQKMFRKIKTYLE